ncbi:MAG TPA: tRNA dihydrouridine synthase DusB [Acidimicrobiia bacterium]|nr:tRNA dihydrouridine synthase DusB [Acidimicrobiia bacterium]
MSFSIGNLHVDPPVVLAPMAGVTNAPFRRLCREFGAGLYVSEMIGARGLVERNEKTMALARFDPDEIPRSIQLYGTDPASLGGAVRMLVAEQGIDHIDMNFGCPMGKVTRHGGGAALPWKRDLFRSIVRAAVSNSGDVPVTVKFRKGIDDDHLTFIETGLIAEEEGAASVALHARTARQLYSGDADWEAIAQLKGAVTSIPVLGNGDIWTADDAVRMMDVTGCDGVVVGRGCLGRPWLFRDLADVFASRPVQAPPNLGEVGSVMIRHARLLVDHFGDPFGINLFRKHPSWYLKGFPVGPVLRDAFSRVSSLSELEDLVGKLDADVPFPEQANHMVRGHSHGPRPVRLPHGFLDDRDGAQLDREAEEVVSGG